MRKYIEISSDNASSNLKWYKVLLKIPYILLFISCTKEIEHDCPFESKHDYTYFIHRVLSNLISYYLRYYCKYPYSTSV